MHICMYIYIYIYIQGMFQGMCASFHLLVASFDYLYASSDRFGAQHARIWLPSRSHRILPKRIQRLRVDWQSIGMSIGMSIGIDRPIDRSIGMGSRYNCKKIPTVCTALLQKRPHCARVGDRIRDCIVRGSAAHKGLPLTS